MSSFLYEPTAHWPNALKLALSVGTKKEWPFARVLNQFFHKFLDTSLRQTHRLSPEHLSLESQRQHLTHLGFYCQTLNSTQLQGLYMKHTQLLQHRSSTWAARQLIRIYLGPCTTSRGYPIDAFRFNRENRSHTLRMGEDQHKKNILWIQPENKTMEQSLQEEFLQTYNSVIHDGPRPIISSPCQTGSTEAFILKDKTQIHRRLPCPTFQK